MIMSHGCPRRYPLRYPSHRFAEVSCNSPKPGTIIAFGWNHLMHVTILCHATVMQVGLVQQHEPISYSPLILACFTDTGQDLAEHLSTELFCCFYATQRRILTQRRIYRVDTWFIYEHCFLSQLQIVPKTFLQSSGTCMVMYCLTRSLISKSHQRHHFP